MKVLQAVGASMMLATMCNAQSGAADAIAALSGAWRVTAVELRPNRVQALSENDPAYVGAMLDVSADRIAWRPHAGGGTLDDVCSGPRLTVDKIHCGAGAFGPPDSKVTVSGNRIVLEWYDNAKLVLQRIP